MSAAQSRLDEYVKQLASYFKKRKLTLHGFRSGADVSLALSRASLHEIVDHVVRKTPQTALRYIKLASLDSAVLDVYTEWIELQGFSQAYCKF